MTKSSPERRARRQHAMEAFVVRVCSDCGRSYVLRGEITPVAECASGDEANARAHELAREYGKQNAPRQTLVVVASDWWDTTLSSPDDDALRH